MGLILAAQFRDVEAMKNAAVFYASVSERKEYRLFPDISSEVSYINVIKQQHAGDKLTSLVV
jgi:hypothetical protein